MDTPVCKIGPDFLKVSYCNRSQECDLTSSLSFGPDECWGKVLNRLNFQISAQRDTIACESGSYIQWVGVNEYQNCVQLWLLRS